MNFLQLLGRPLKSDEVIDVLEGLDMTVTYDFDRLHEGSETCIGANPGPTVFSFDSIRPKFLP